MEESMHVGEQETSLQDQSYHTIRRKIVYQAFLRQANQSLAHGRATHVQVIAKLLDAQLFARLVVQVDDFASNGVVGLVL